MRGAALHSDQDEATLVRVRAAAPLGAAASPLPAAGAPLFAPAAGAPAAAAPLLAPGAAAPLLAPAAAAAVFEVVRRRALQQDLAGAGYVLRRAVAEATASDRVYLLFHEVGTGALWSFDEGVRAPDCGGLAERAARTGAALCAERAADWPDYRVHLDDPEGDGSERLVVQPLATGGAPIAVLVAVRRGSAPPYGPGERALACALGAQAAPIVQHFLLAHQAQAREAAAAERALFRREAIALHRAGARPGDVLRLSSSWLRWGYGSLIAAVALALVVAAVTPVSRYSAGPAVVRVDGHPVTAAEPGTVAAVHVASG